MSLSDLSTSLEETLAPFAGREHDPFDTPEAKANTAFNNEQARAMAEHLAVERQRRATAGVQIGESRS